MPSVTYNGQSFAIDGRRFWLLGASVQYARLPIDAWRRMIAAARDAGFNTIETACPWVLHEPRMGRFDFSGQADVRRFVTMCGEMGMRVLLRPGPFIGTGYDGGGLPAWLAELPNIHVREHNEQYLERVFIYLRKLLNELDGMQITKTSSSMPQGGPILLIQAEHAWQCANSTQATKYLREINRVIRECGFNIPITNANDLWQDVPGTIDTWRGSEDLLEHLRQFRTVQSDAPRVLSEFQASELPVWGGSTSIETAMSPAALLHNLAQCFAAGAQPIVSPFVGGVNFGFLGGRLPGGPDRYCTTATAVSPPLSEGRARGEHFAVIRRLLTFANSFSHVFADLDPDYQPIVPMIPPAPTNVAGVLRRKRTASSAGPAPGIVVPQDGPQGRVAFVFHGGAQESMELLLENGVRLSINLPAQPVAWYVFDADLGGSGRLDYANLCPFALAGRSILVLYGRAKSEAFVSINGSPLQARVPAGRRPLVMQHKGITVVICNEQQIDTMYTNETGVYVGVAGFDADGVPIPHEGVSASVITADGAMRTLGDDEAGLPSSVSDARSRRTLPLGTWQAAPATAYTSGESPRYASLSGPSTLMSCGAPLGYGWYRITLNVKSARKRLCTLPEAADRIHLYLNGSLQRLFGTAPGASSDPFNLKLERGENVIVALADNLGRFADGNELLERKGLFGHMWEVKPLRTVKPKRVEGEPVDPFVLRGYIAGLAKGQLGQSEQLEWKFKHAKKSPVLIEINGAPCTGTFVLNGTPIAYYAGQTGSTMMRLLIGSETHDAFKRGNNVLRFAPDQGQPNAHAEMSKAATLYECVGSLTEGASWSFAKWEPPPTKLYEGVTKTAAKQKRGAPCWWRSTFDCPEHLNMPLWFDTRGLSKGQIFLNGQNLGRYFTATATNKSVGPQTRLWLPTSWLRAEQPNELWIFDEHGCDPSKTRLVLSAAGAIDRHRG